MDGFDEMVGYISHCIVKESYAMGIKGNLKIFNCDGKCKKLIDDYKCICCEKYRIGFLGNSN